jgi:prepilin-type N-terminal cleavage/methylation domain-containing protein
VQTTDLQQFIAHSRPRHVGPAVPIRRKRRGFTMIEVLVTIGIIMILVAIGVIAFRGLDKMASERATHTALDNANAMLAEYEHGGRLDALVIVDPTRPDQFPPVGNAFWYATATDSIDTTQSSVNLNDVGPSGISRKNAIQQSGAVVVRLIRTPKNKSAIGAMPQKSLIEQPQGSAIQAPAFADGWRNPILFCPAGGIRVNLSTGSAPLVVTAPDHRPFWASAGPDGDFSKGDDNVYSFSK